METARFSCALPRSTSCRRHGRHASQRRPTTRLSSPFPRRVPTASTSRRWSWFTRTNRLTRCSTKGSESQARRPISAYYEVSHVNNPDIFALKGDNALGTSFHLPFQNFTDNGFNTSVWIRHRGDGSNTTMTITPTQDLIGHPAGVPFDVNLPFAGSTYSGRGRRFRRLTRRDTVIRPPSRRCTTTPPAARRLEDVLTSWEIKSSLTTCSAQNTLPFMATWLETTGFKFWPSEQHRGHGRRRPGGNPSSR